MVFFIKQCLPPALRYPLQSLVGFAAWYWRDCTPPIPSAIKRRVLLRNGTQSATWVETGTYLGDMTHFLAKHASKVFSIEPEPKLYGIAKKRFAKTPNIEIINGSSESAFPDLLPRLSGNVNFWLDAHYSGGTTWSTYKGPQETPIVDELSNIEKRLGDYQKVAVMVDDVGSFLSANTNSSYPRLDYLVEWARRNSLNWHIEYDIFVAKKV